MGTLRLVCKDMRRDVLWVEREWVERLRGEREERFRRWWGGLEVFVGGGGGKGG